MIPVDTTPSAIAQACAALFATTVLCVLVEPSTPAGLEAEAKGPKVSSADTMDRLSATGLKSGSRR
jgi:hypothetical protein